MAAPQVAVEPSAAYSAGCTAISSVISSASGTGFSIEEYSLSATAANGWRFSHFTCHLTASTTNPNPDPSWQSYDADFSSTDNPADSVYNEQYGHQTIRSGYFDYEILEIGTGRDEWTVTDIVAHFEQVTYAITTAVSPSGSGTATGGGTYASGATANLTATANSGYMFLRWELNGVTASTSAAFSVTVTGNATYTAVFRQFTNLLVNSATVESPAKLVYDPTTNRLVADY